MEASATNQSRQNRRTRILSIGMGWFHEEPGGLNRMYAGILDGMNLDRALVYGLVAGMAPPFNPRRFELEFFERRQASMLRRMWACRRFFKRIHTAVAPDVVAAHFSPYAFPVLDLLANSPFVFHFHGPWADESTAEREASLSTFIKRQIELTVYRRSDRFIVLSKAFRTILSTNFGVPPDRIEIIPGGVDVSRFSKSGSRNEARAELGLPVDVPIVGVVRRLVHRVGLENLINAIARVRAKHPAVLLLVGGTGPLASQLKAQVEVTGLTHNVRMLGFVSDDQLPLLYRACDLSIVPSISLEGFGLTTIESLAAGTPVLVTPVGGLPETVEGLDPGLVLADATVESLEQGLIGALSDLHKLPSMESCCEYARSNFDWPVIANKVLAVYQNAIAHHKDA